MHRFKISRLFSHVVCVAAFAAALALPINALYAATGKVSTTDLMKAMQDSLNNPSATVAPPAVQGLPPARTLSAVQPPVASAPAGIEASPLPVQTVQPVKTDTYTPTATAPATAAPSEGVKSEARIEPTAPAPEAPKVAEPVPASNEGIDKPSAKTADVPPPAPATTGAPLLSDMADAPVKVENNEPVAASGTASPAATQAKAAQREGFSADRPLFSTGNKRSGVVSHNGASVAAPAPTAASKSAHTTSRKLFSAPAETAPAPANLPPVTPSPYVVTPPAPATVVTPVPTSNAAPSGTGEGGITWNQPRADTASAEKKIIDSDYALEAQPVPQNYTNNNLTPTAITDPNQAAVQGSCGAANGIGTPAAPAANLCTQGTPSDVAGSGPWSWNCGGQNGGMTASCAAPLQINGDCGAANGSQSTTTPMGGLCNSGKASEVSGNGPWYWNCFGDNGGVVAQCVAYTLVSGQCGASHNVAAATAPSSALCAAGTATNVSGTGPWSWSCQGTGEGTSVTCNAPALRQGTCGMANNTGSAVQPSANLCSSGTPTAITGNGPWNWTCQGENGAASSNCSAPMLSSGACGPSHGIGMSVRPTDSLCSQGTPSEVTGTGPWAWNCYGLNGGPMVNCMSPLKLDGACGPSHLNGLISAPLTGLCNSGTPSQVIGSGPWQWTCAASGGGITANCMANPLVNAACGAAHGVSTAIQPIADLCNQGSPTPVTGNGPWMWTCTGTQGGSASNCMAPIQINGACGASDNMPTSMMPTGNLCRTGVPSAVSGSGPWMWSCVGAGGGISSSCQAPLQQQASPQAQAPQVQPEATAATPPADVVVPEAAAKAGNECSPSVRRWTITCQQGGYPANYTGMIVGETQTLCPTNVERGVWLSNSCAPATNSAPYSPAPGILKNPQPPTISSVMPDIQPLPAKALEKPRRLATPQFRDDMGNAAIPSSTGPMIESVTFGPTSEGLDANATDTLTRISDNLQVDAKSIATLNAFAAMPADNNQQEARRLSLARALAVRSFLMRRGIASNRIDIRALGPAGDGHGDDRVDITVK